MQKVRVEVSDSLEERPKIIICTVEFYGRVPR